MSFTHGQAPHHISPPPMMNTGHPMTHPTQPPSALGGNSALMQSSAFVPPEWNVADLSNDISCFLAEAVNLLDVQLIRAKEKKKMKEQERQRELMARSRTFAQPQQRRHRSRRHQDPDGDGHRSLNASMSASQYNANRGLAQGAAPGQAPEYHRSRSMNAAHQYPQQPQYGQAYTYDYPQAAYQSQDYGGGNIAANPSMPQMNGVYHHQPQQPQPSAYNGRLAGAQSMYQLNDRNSTRSHRRHHHDSSRSHYGSEYRSQRGGAAPSVYVTDDRHSMFTRDFLTRGPIPRGARADINIEPVNTRCPQCRQLVTTDIQKHIGTKNYAVTAAVAALGLIIKAPVTVMPLALTTYGLNFLKSKVHVCPECGYKMGKHVTISIPRGY